MATARKGAERSRAGGAASRNSANRREAILNAAVEEFKAKGFAGARVDNIARLSGSNKQLIYYYFKDKAGLYDEVLSSMIGRSHERLDASAPASFRQIVALNTAAGFDDSRDWFRFWMWEALDKPASDITKRAERTEVWKGYVDSIRQAQERGELDAVFDPALLALALTAATSFPHQFPHLTRLITGAQPDKASFRRRQEEFMSQLAEHLAPPRKARPRARQPSAAVRSSDRGSRKRKPAASGR